MTQSIRYSKVYNEVVTSIRTQLPKLAQKTISRGTGFIDDLEMDLIELTELIFTVEEKFKIDTISGLGIRVVDDLVEVIFKRLCPTELEYADISKILPHRQGFILIDRVTFLETDMNPPQIRGIYNVSGSAWWARDHFPGNPIMPEKLMGEGLSQMAGLLLYFLSGIKKERVGSIGGGDYTVHKPALPGDIVEYFVEKEKFKKSFYLFKGTVEVNGFKSFSQMIKLAKM